MNKEIRENLQQFWSDAYIKECNKENKHHIFHLYQRVGKIKTTLNCIIKLKLNNPKILISYPDNQILTSWQQDFVKFNYNSTNITFTNKQSLEKYVNSKFDIFIIDEIHNLSDNNYIYVNKIISNTSYVIGLSGTINKEKKQELYNTLGLKILIEYNKEQAIKDNLISDYEIEIHLVKLDNKIQKKNSKDKLVTEKQSYDNFTYVINDLKSKGKDTFFMNISRNKILQSSISKQNKVKELLNILKDKRVLVFTGLTKTADSLGIPSFHSKSKNNNLIKFQNGVINHLAMANMGGIGVSYYNLDCVILSNFTHDSAKTDQNNSRSMINDYEGKVSKIIIISTDEPLELKKLQKSLLLYDSKKIKYFNNL